MESVRERPWPALRAWPATAITPRRAPRTLSAHGTGTDDTPAFTVQDRNYLSARWPGDAYLFGRRFCDLLAS